jgi:hypothetical protein
MANKKSRIISMDDIDRKNKMIERDQIKKDIAGDINDVFNFITKPNPKKKDRSWLWTILIIIGAILLIITIINFILANIWLLKFFIKDFSESLKGLIK